MNKIIGDWDTLPLGVKVMTIISAILTVCGAYGVVLNIESPGDFAAGVLYIGYYGWTALIFPGIVSRSARARGGRMLKWYLFSFFLGVFLPVVGMAAVTVYYMYFWRSKHPVTVVPGKAEGGWPTPDLTSE